MEQSIFLESINAKAKTIEAIRARAHAIHANVNQHYDNHHPYGYHLDMVVDNVRRYGAEVCATERDIVPIFFGAYFHDSIEDARLTYNDVLKQAKEFMNDEQALMATEIVYALTNEKGRTRAERADGRYYSGIRQTPYAPMVKLADRLANALYSSHSNEPANVAMHDVYVKEWPHFHSAIKNGSQVADIRLRLPVEMEEGASGLLG